MTNLPLHIRKGKKVRGELLTFTIGDPLGRGGSGVVYQAQCVETAVPLALKFFLPLYQLNLSLFDSTASQQKALKEISEFHRKELQALRAIRHPGIVYVLDHGLYSPPKTELSKEIQVVGEVNFLAMEYVDGLDIATHFATHSISRATVATVLGKLADALAYLHDVKEYLHGDIRAGNILVRKDTADPVIIDFSLYKNFNFNEVVPTEITRLHGDWDLFPKALVTNDPLKRFKETEGQRDHLKNLCFPGLDLFQLGKLLQSLRPSLARLLLPEDIEYYDLITSELLTWPLAKELRAVHLKSQFDKLHPSYSQLMGVEELTPPTCAKQTHQIPGRVLTTSPLIDRLANTNSFRRLRSINQLAFIDILYPGAGYRRHLHSLRAYAYCGQLLQSLAQGARFRSLFNPQLARQALVAALLHDINHFPLLHIFQELEGEYIRDIDLLDHFCDGKATRDTPSLYELAAEAGLERARFRDLLLLEHHNLAERGYDAGLQIIKSMIDSGADVDKLAYLYDDSLFTGVAYGSGVDADRLLAAAVAVQTPLGAWHVGYREEGLPAVESLVMARYWMFRTVYWHRTNRALMAMLMHVLRRIYVEQRANAAEFVRETMWLSEEGVLEYLDAKYKHHFGEESITRLLLRQRDRVYHRLASIQGGVGDTRDADLYEKLRALDSATLVKWRESLTEGLKDFTRAMGIVVPFRDDTVLFDIPRRRLDTSGAIYIAMETGDIRPIQDLAGPVQRVVTEFEKLAKRIRIFIAPAVGEHLTRELLAKKRGDLLKLAEDAIPKASAAQVR